MLRIIKKSFKYFTILLGILLLVPTFFYLIIRNSDAQTFIINRITSHLSSEIKSSITVGRIDFTFFNKLVINDLLIKDQHQDTLIYSNKLTAGIRRLDIVNNKIRVGKAELEEAVFALITDTTGMMNLAWYLDLLDSPGSKEKKGNFSLSINKIDIKNSRFSLRDERGVQSKRLIEFNNLNINDIYGSIEDFAVEGDSVGLNILNLRFREKNGFIVNDLTTGLSVANNDISFTQTQLICDTTVINAEKIILDSDTAGSFRNFTEDVRLDIALKRSLVSTSELRYFLPFLQGYNESVWFSGNITGTIAELKGRNIEVNYGEQSYLDCDFDFSGLPEFRNAFIHIGVNNFTTSANDIGKVVIPGKGRIIIPEAVKKLDKISFDGSFTGFTTDFVTYGEIRTGKGSIRTDLSLRLEGKNRFRISGLITGSEIDLGVLAGKEEFLGKLSMDANVDGYTTSFRNFSGNLTGKVDSLELNKYVYRNIDLNGVFSENTWDGSIKVVDKNVKLDLLGLLDFSEKLPEFDFTLNLADANLYNLNFDKKDTTALISLLMTANFRGNSIDNLDGEIRLLNSTLRRKGNKLDLYNFSVKAFTERNRPAISVRTDFADADIRGYYNFSGMGKAYQTTLSELMPSKFSVQKSGKEVPGNNFTFTVNFKNTDRLNEFFETGLLISEKSTLTGTFNPDSLLALGMKAGMINIKNNVFRNLDVSAIIRNRELNATLKSTSLSIFGQSALNDFSAGMKTKPDNFVFDFHWDNKEKILNNGSFIARGEIVKKENDEKGSFLKVTIDSSGVYTRNNLWVISRSEIIVDSNYVDISDFRIRNRENYYLVDGTVSDKKTDTLKLKFKGIDLNPLNNIGKTNDSKGDEGIPLDIKGILNGNIFASNVLESPLLESNIVVSNFSMLGSDYGNMSIASVWNASKRLADIKAFNDLSGKRMIDIEGTYNPESRILNIVANARKLPVDALNPLLDFFASGIKGTVSGKVNLSGEFSKLNLKGAVLAENTSMKIDYLQTQFRLNDSIRFDNNGIKFNKVRLTDEKGNPASINGEVRHRHFKNWAADLVINTDGCLVLNTQARDNELFYGVAYATGVTTIRSGPDLLSFDISARTDKNTRFFIPLNSGLSVSEHSFITFFDKDSTDREAGKKQVVAQVQKAGSGLELKFDLDVTPDAEVQLLIDPKAGDVIKGKGTGDLNISLNQKGDFRVSGDYTIEEGEYLFTLGNFLNKRFDVESGGKISFPGNIDDAEIELKATYKNLRTSLSELLGDEHYNERIPVEPQLNLSGKLFNPLVGFNINLPNADEQTKTYVRNAITTEEELSRQFLYLLVMNSFYADPAARSSLGSGASGSAGGSAMAVTTTEMLSNQLSNWLSQISNDFDIGFVYRPGKDVNSQEVQVALSTQLLNDKVTINGNFDVRGENDTYGNPITGDFDIEYRIAEKIRFKVFNRYNNPYTGKGVPYTQGFGLFYKQDFNKFSDLFKRKPESDMKKEDDVTVR